MFSIVPQNSDSLTFAHFSCWWSPWRGAKTAGKKHEVAKWTTKLLASEKYQNELMRDRKCIFTTLLVCPHYQRHDQLFSSLLLLFFSCIFSSLLKLEWKTTFNCNRTVEGRHCRIHNSLQVAHHLKSVLRIYTQHNTSLCVTRHWQYILLIVRTASVRCFCKKALSDFNVSCAFHWYYGLAVQNVKFSL